MDLGDNCGCGHEFCCNSNDGVLFEWRLPIGFFGDIIIASTV